MLYEKRCLKCDGYLILRKGRYGVFWGCLNYPKCLFAQDLTDEELENYLLSGVKN